MHNVIDELNNSSLVETKVIEDGQVTVYNFTREAFYTQSWDGLTTKARGLFVNRSGDIVTRGYEKFFNLNERPETEVDALVQHAAGGNLLASIKENGFLGLLSARLENNVPYLVYYTKKGPSDYATMFQTIMQETFSRDELTEMANFLWQHNVTATFEVIDPNIDPHINTGYTRGVILLDLIRNDWVFSTDDVLRDDFATEYDFRTPERVIHSGDNIISVIEEARNLPTEGMVIRLADGFMFKVKSDSYNDWKGMRTSLNRVLFGKTPHLGRFNERQLKLWEKIGTLDLQDYMVETLQGSLAVSIPQLRDAVEKN